MDRRKNWEEKLEEIGRVSNLITTTIFKCSFEKLKLKSLTIEKNINLCYNMRKYKMAQNKNTWNAELDLCKREKSKKMDFMLIDLLNFDIKHIRQKMSVHLKYPTDF